MTHKRFLIGGLRLAVLMTGIAAALFGRASSTETDYSGHYELADTKAGRTFSLDVKQTGSRAVISFSATMTDGSGASPDGTGRGRVEDGVLSFKFKDSFNNEGTCTLASGPHGYQLNMTVTKVVDPGPFHFYGSIPLKRVAAN